MEFEGKVIESNRGLFRVELDEGLIVQCTLSGKIRQNAVKILVDDRVRVEVSEYSPERGRIVYRYKAGD
jgi:translation initiation factor IF-1